jgi:hypothetical protein
MGWLVLGFLTAFALLDALGLALRIKPSGRAEVGIATALFFAALIGMPVLGLGYANVLWRATLAPTSLALFVGVFWLLARKDGARALLVSCGAALRDLAALPLDALRESLRARSLVFVGLLVAAALIGISFVLTYLIEFCRWDDEIYHTPIVGWAIQHHGFAIVDAPKPGVGGTNGYPKLCEGLCLWFVFFTDKTLLELPATLFAPPMLLCVYGMARRFTDRVCAMGFAVVILLVPHTWRQFCSSYADMEMAFFLLAATYWATSCTEQRFRNTLMCSVAMALAAGSKTTWLLFVPPVAFVAYARLIRRHFASRRRDVVLALAGSAVSVLGVGALCVGRNWWHYKNPVWPVAYDIPKIGIHWPGLFTPEEYRGHDPSVMEGFGIPKGGMRDVMRHGYGLAITWLGGPVGLAAIVAWGVAVVRGLFRGRLSESVLGIGAVMIPCLVWLAVGPNFGQPRYNLHVVGALLIACAWWVGGPRSERLREGLLGAMLVLSLIPLFWVNDANVASLEEERERLLHPFANRPYSLHPSFDLLEREKYEELGPGDEVVFSDGVAFPGLLWNFDFSNRVDYVEFAGTGDFLAKLAELDPKWVCVGEGGSARKTLEQTNQWVLVGRTNPGLGELAFRRREPASPPSGS